MSSTLWRLATAGAVVCLSAEARAQSACELETRSDFVNFTYDPSRPFSLRDGFLSVGANDVFADNEHMRRTASRFLTKRASDENLTFSARVDVTDAVADVQTYLFGYGEAGIELLLEVRDSSGTVICSDLEQLYVARYFEHGEPPDGIRTLSCAVFRSAGDTEGFTASVTAHAWIAVGLASGAYASFDGQIVDVSLNGCSGTCSGACGGVSSGGCFCDDACTGFGDCCADFAPICARDSCWERCDAGISPDATCFCDDACTGFGDCCEDVADTCG